MNYIGIDVGGTKIFAAKYSPNFEILDSIKIPTSIAQSNDCLIKDIIEIIGQLKDDQTKSIGISWAGLVQSDKKTIKVSPNIKGFCAINLGSIIQEWFCLPTIVENDSRCFAIAEQYFNKDQTSDLLGITFGTGIGSGIIINQAPLLGAQNYAGEIGHQLLNGKEAEKLFAGPALKKIFKKNLKDVIKMPKTKIKKQITNEIKMLAHWLFNISLTLNPEVIVLGGWVSINFWSRFIPEIGKEIKKLAKKCSLPIKLKIKISKLENAESIGAAILAKKL